MILYLAQKLATCLLAKFVPLSDTMVRGKPEAAHYVLSKKLDKLLSGDFGEWHCLNPFGEVVDCYQ